VSAEEQLAEAAVADIVGIGQGWVLTWDLSLFYVAPSASLQTDNSQGGKNVKRTLTIALVLSFFAAALVAPVRGGSAAGQSRICRPTQEELQACEEAGGWFDYGLCKCRIF
jgi:hypothetical protein